MSKIVIVGGGSAMWTRAVVSDIVSFPALHDSELVLLDIDEQRLHYAEKLARKVIHQTGIGLKLSTTLDRKKSLINADFVIIGISVGGNDEWVQDIEIPWKEFNIFQTVGDTIGPGGIFRSLRHIPAVMDIARDIAAICPNAFVIQLTNPMTPICRAIEKTMKLNMIGYCHGVWDTENMIAEELGFSVEDVKLYAYGINHFLFIKSLLVRGEEGLALLKQHADFKDNHPALYEMWNTFGQFVINKDRHPVEFVPFYLNPRTQYGKDYKLNQDMTYWHINMSRNLIHDIEQTLQSTEPLDTSKSTEYIVDIMNAIKTNQDFVVHVNIRNNGAIANLPMDCNVEVPALINRRGVHPFVMGELSHGVSSLVRRIVDEQELIVEAALTGSRELAVQALALDPLVHDIRVANRLFDAMYKAQKQYLPQFA